MQRTTVSEWMTCTLGLLLALMPLAMAADPNPSSSVPVASKGAVRDTFFGEQLADPYRWMEEAGSAETRSWTEAENRVSDRYFTHLTERKRILEQFRQR
jgi:prolyl oligopeptidase